MDIEQLRELGGLVSPTPVEKEITWQPRNEDGSPRGEPVTFTVLIKKLSSGDSERLWVVDEKARDRSSHAALLSASLMLGERFITYEEAFQLDPSLAVKFSEAVNQVNGWSDAAAKNSQPPTNSGTTS
jgi:hypothetical protein